jgi:hypothetical protein
VPIKEVLGARPVMHYLHAHLFACAVDERRSSGLLHAACLHRGGRRVLLAGTKGAGKTTLTFRLLAAGFEVEGDEHVFLDDSGVVARPRACRVKEAALPHLGTLAGAVARSPSCPDDAGGRIFSVDPRALGTSWRIETGWVDRVVVLHPNHGGYSSMRSLRPSALVQVLMSEIGLPRDGRGRAVAALAILASRAEAFDLSFGDLPTAVRCIDLATGG